MTAPTREQREEWRRGDWVECALDPQEAHARILALLDALDAAEERLAAVRALAEQWATQEPQSDGFSEGQISSGDQILQLLGGNS